MGRRCSTCVHPEVEQINAALTRREPYRQIAAQFGLACTSLRRHRLNHGTEAVWQPWVEQIQEFKERLEQRDSQLAKALVMLAREVEGLRRAKPG